uniref:NADH dehydrogenase subunit 4L n=1 Tax=Cocculina enigmadonta TaxID=2729702 RepID=UPI0021FC95A3|nr:NADH dehydrogenase subunit 4L [Cocculina enigmadonta]UXN84353.1 NADH dehydrogenase subunit 4L [Cocculina enigmadonta]
MEFPFLIVLGVFGSLFSVLSLSMQSKHLLSSLLSLEALMMSLFVLLLSCCFFLNSESHLVLMFITLGGCEASLGLAILVSLIRTHGNDYVYSFNSHKC